MGELVTPIDEVRRFIISCFEAVGTCREHADIAAENLIEADCRGHYSHGLNRLHWYINDIVNKVVDPNVVPEIEKETVATALVNGKSGLGSIVGKYCMELAIKKAKDVGIGMVTVHSSNHYGIAGIYPLQAMREGCIGISTTNTSPIMVPTRAKQAALGSNPISIGASGQDGDGLLLDMATTTVALGKLEVSRRKGQPIPNGWALNENGEMETDPKTAIDAERLVPLGGDELTGGYKGYGLAAIVELLTGTLAGGNFGPNIPQWNRGEPRIANLGQTFIAINPQVFASGFEKRLSDLTSHLRNMEPRDPSQPVLVPGDPEQIHMKKIKAQGGICYVKDQHESNSRLAEKLNVLPMKSLEKRPT